MYRNWLNRVQRVTQLESKSSAAIEDWFEVSIQDGGPLPAGTTRTEAAKGTIDIDTRWLTFVVPNMAVSSEAPALLKALIFEPPEPAESFMEPEVSTTTAISSSIPFAMACAVTGIEFTPIRLAKNTGASTFVSSTAVVVLRSMETLVTEKGPAL